MILSKKHRIASKRARERYQDLSEEEKNKECQYAHEQYRNLSEEEKNKKHQNGVERYRNLPEDEKQRLDEYRKIILKSGKRRTD